MKRQMNNFREPLRLAFVNITREYNKLPLHYVDFFNKFHLESPVYFSNFGKNKTKIITVDNFKSEQWDMVGGGHLQCIPEQEYLDGYKGPYDFDVVIHWRKFSEKLYRRSAINVMICQDFGFSSQWKKEVLLAFEQRKLYAILCFDGWHKENLYQELSEKIPKDRLVGNLTLGVDSDIYKPDWQNKDPYKLLWASDPGRGLNTAIEIAIKLFQKDKRFRLHICAPDYAKNEFNLNHPALIWHGNIPNGPKLWDLFNTSSTLCYPSNFMEPSSRACRQAQAAGCMVVYPENRGTPSEYLQGNPSVGVVIPVEKFVDTIYNKVNSNEWMVIGSNARELAVSENWEVVSKRFNKYFDKLVYGEEE